MWYHIMWRVWPYRHSLCRILCKSMASGSLLVVGFFTVVADIAIAYDNHNAVLLASLTVAARFGVAISYESGSQYATELIPTCKSYSKRKRNQSLTIGLECNHETDANRSNYT
ncbi:hypothetical protein GQX74_003907 [Glossina fuscipes]|nr:hypothetical protein GQX74_003907 [Glossina fuscipes]